MCAARAAWATPKQRRVLEGGTPTVSPGFLICHRSSGAGRVVFGPRVMVLCQRANTQSDTDPRVSLLRRRAIKWAFEGPEEPRHPPQARGILHWCSARWWAGVRKGNLAATQHGNGLSPCAHHEFHAARATRRRAAPRDGGGQTSKWQHSHRASLNFAYAGPCLKS